MEKLNLSEIQAEYLDIIESVFKKELDELSFNEEFPEKAIEYIKQASNHSIYVRTGASRMSFLDQKIQVFREKLDDYWSRNQEIIQAYCRNTESNKIVFWIEGDDLHKLPKMLSYYDFVLFPDATRNLAKRALGEEDSINHRRDILFHVVLIHSLKHVISTDDPTPPFVLFEREIKDRMLGLKREDDILGQENLLLKKAFQKLVNQELVFDGDKNDLRQLNLKEANQNIDRDFAQKLIGESIYRANQYYKNSPEIKQLNAIINNQLKEDLDLDAFLYIYQTLNNNFKALDEREIYAHTFHSSNLITTGFSSFNNFKYECISEDYGDCMEIPSGRLVDYSLSQDFEWLSHLSLDQVLEIRKTDSFHRYREIVARKSYELQLANFEDFPLVASDFSHCIQQELKTLVQQENKLIADKAIKITKTTASFGLTGILTLASCAFPSLFPFTLASAGYSIYAGASYKDLLNQINQGNSEIKDLGRRSLSAFVK